MQDDLKVFLDLICRENLQSCSIEITDERVFLTWAKPKHTTLTFQNIKDLEEHLSLTSSSDDTQPLSMTFFYKQNQRIYLDILMGHLYELNNVSLVALEKLSRANLIGKGKLIEEIKMDFSEI